MFFPFIGRGKEHAAGVGIPSNQLPPDEYMLKTSLLKHPMETPNMRYIRFKELRKLIPLGRTTIWRMMREGRFPQSRRIGKMATAWLESEVDEWIRQRSEEGGNTETLRNRRPEYGQT